MKRILLLLFLCVSAFAQRQNPLWTIVGAGASVPGSCSGHTIFIYTTDGSYRYCNGSSFVNPFSGMAMTYPGAGVANSTGSAWGTSYTVGTGANNLVQLNGSSQLPAVSAALLTNFPTLNQSTSGTAANLSGAPALPNGTTVTTQTQGDNSTKAASTAYTDTGLGAKAASTAATTVNGQSCALSGTCTVTAVPSGSASGDLSGPFPSPTVSRIHDALTTVNNAASPYTVVSTDSYIACDATAGAVIITLPAATATGREISVKKTDSSSNACTPTRAGSDLIDGAASYSLTTQYAASKIVDQASGVWARSHVNQLVGDVTGVSTANTVKSLNGTLLSGLATGIVKITTSTGVPSIAIAADFPTLNQNTTGNAATVTNLTLANTLTTSGNFPLTLTTTASTNVTLPTSGTLVNTTVSTLSSLASVGTITTGTWQATKLGLVYGGTNADLSGTGGTSQVLKQTTLGGAITVARLACADLSDSGAGCNGSGTPAGSTTQFQVNNAGAFGGLASATFTGSFGTANEGVMFQNPVASTGATSVVFKAGAGQGSTSIINVQNASGVSQFTVAASNGAISTNGTITAGGKISGNALTLTTAALYPETAVNDTGEALESLLDATGAPRQFLGSSFCAGTGFPITACAAQLKNDGTLNGTSVNVTSAVLTGKATTYNNVATAGIGVPPVYASVSLTGQTASITATNLQCGGAICPAGTYRVKGYEVVTATGTGTVLTTIGWNDGTAARTSATAGVATTSTTFEPVDVVLRADGVNNVTYATTLSVSGTYSLYLTMERLQ